VLQKATLIASRCWGSLCISRAPQCVPFKVLVAHDSMPVQVLGQMLNGVTALHAQGYAHRNIKPSNILRRLKQHDWVLSDFAFSVPLSACHSKCLLCMHWLHRLARAFQTTAVPYRMVFALGSLQWACSSSVARHNALVA
jgi:hypothetical protein